MLILAICCLVKLVVLVSEGPSDAAVVDCLCFVFYVCCFVVCCLMFVALVFRFVGFWFGAG